MSICICRRFRIAEDESGGFNQQEFAHPESLGFFWMTVIDLAEVHDIPGHILPRLDSSRGSIPGQATCAWEGRGTETRLLPSLLANDLRGVASTVHPPRQQTVWRSHRGEHFGKDLAGDSRARLSNSMQRDEPPPLRQSTVVVSLYFWEGEAREFATSETGDSTFIELMTGMAIIAIVDRDRHSGLSGLPDPNSSVVVMTDGAETAVSEFYGNAGRFPGSDQSAGQAFDTPGAGG